MSAFEKYDETSRHYDVTRVPVGAEIILGCLDRQDKPLHELKLLDAGCGTGAYSHAILDHIGHIEAIDLSQGMLDQARQKLLSGANAGRIRFSQASITELPFDAGSFDAVMINQVAHHLDDSFENGFALLRQMAGEFARVLRPGGALVFNHCSQEQINHAYWYYHLAPQARDAMGRCFAPLETLRQILEDTGFINQDSFVPHDAVCQGEAYFDGRGPLNKAWRDGDSFWAQVSEEELDAALEQVRRLDAADELEDFVVAHDLRRPALGQITFLYAERA